jgi:hypothetical protein
MRRIAALTLALVSSANAQTLLIDGQTHDWPPTQVVVSDPAGDATGEMDLTEIAGLIVGDVLTLRVRFASTLNLVAGASAEPDLLIVVESQPGLSVELAARGRTLTRRDTGDVLTWDSVRYVSAPTFASDVFEIRLDFASLGGLMPAGASVSVEGADALAEPLVVARTPPSSDPPHTTADASAGQSVPGATPAQVVTERVRDFRLISLNTLRTGLSDPVRGPALHRLIVATQGDVLILQEEYNSTAAQVQATLNEIRPLADGNSWQVHKRGDNVIASIWDLEALPNLDASYAAAAVMTSDGPVVVLSIHPKCCGFIGSPEDLQRIGQTERMAQLVEEVRSGKHNSGVDLTNAPVIIGGDWNLVGSRTPLDLLTEPNLARMGELTLPRRASADLVTWRELGGRGFPPGRLDLFVFDTGRLAVPYAEVWDTGTMAPERLARLGLSETDSRASDHLLLVADFRVIPEHEAGD